jgi:hypothetical protein
MPSAVDTFLKISLAASLLAAGGSVGYYYAAYLPARDAQLDSERVHAESARKAAEDRVQAEREAAAEQRQAHDKAAAQVRYESCIARAASVRDGSWTSNCKNLADRAQKDRANCTFLPATCDRMFPARDPTVACPLPKDLASSISADLERSKDRCFAELKAGLQ